MSIEAEHQIQIELIDSLRDAIVGKGDAEAVPELLQRLLEYSGLHFQSEELLMRHHSYPRYDLHVFEHHRMTEKLEELRERQRGGETAGLIDAVTEMRAHLLGHIEGPDAELGRFIAEAGKVDDEPDAQQDLPLPRW